MSASLSSKTRTQYRKVIDQYSAFHAQHYPHSQLLPLNSGIIMQFITKLHLSGNSSASITSSVSALNYVNKVTGGQDLYNCFCFSRLVKGIRAINPSRDTRLPITLDILGNLCNAINKIYTDNYESTLLRAMFLLAFHGFLRVGEITCEAHNSQNKNLLHVHNLEVDKHSKQMIIKFTDYKLKADTTAFKLAISPQKELCPIEAMSQYLKLRGNKPGPIFVLNQLPVKRSYFTSRLQTLLGYLKYNTKVYKSHSFRIGAATSAIAKGISSDQVKVMGRWKSDAYKSYIRVQSFAT